MSDQVERISIKPDDLARERLDQLRGRRSLQQVADAVAKTGFKGLSRASLNRVIKGGQPLRVGELFAAAVALGVSPLHFLVPDDEAAFVAVTPGTVVDPRTLMTWLRGTWPSVGDNSEPATFFRSMPAPVQAETLYRKAQADAETARMRGEYDNARRKSEELEAELGTATDDNQRLRLSRELGKLDHYCHVRARAIRKATGADIGPGASAPVSADAFYTLADDDDLDVG